MVNGGYAYGYLHVAQNPHAEASFKTIIETHRPSKLLEIGSLHGGLAMMLRDILDAAGLEQTPIKTYDINEQDFLKPLIKKHDLNIEAVTENLFSSDYKDWKNDKAKQETQEFIATGNPCLVICDGGCKKCEFNLISDMLKPGDVIMAHDYAPNRDYFEKNVQGILWDWLEIEDQDIEEACSRNNLSPYMQEIAQKAVWACRIKN